MSCTFFFSLFYVSFLPLWLSVLFVDVVSICSTTSCHTTEFLSCGTIIILLLYCVTDVKCTLRKVEKELCSAEKKLVEAKVQKTAVTEFLLMYILPLFAFDFPRWDGTVLFLLYFSVLCYMHMKNKIFCVSILLEILGYRVFECKLKNWDKVAADNVAETASVVSRNELRSYIGINISLAKINNEYYVESG